MIQFKNVSKSYGSCVANKSISFDVSLGSIHALVGENGAGKSTLMKLLFGLDQPDSGEILLNQKPLNFESPIQAKKAGFGMVHQHFMLAGPLPAIDHILLDDTEESPGLFSLFKNLPREKKRLELEKVSEAYKMPVPWKEKIENLSVGQQQRIEILKLLYNKAKILILDEPTAVLTPQEIDSLFAQLKELRNQGATILLITHKLKEVFQLADAVTILRQGTSIATKRISETNPTELAELMVGRKLAQNPIRKTTALSQEKYLDIEALNLISEKKYLLKNIHLHVRGGEIVGLAGVEGNGQSLLLQSLLLPKKVPGQISGRAHFFKDNFGLFAEDRIRQAILPELNMLENYLLGQQDKKLYKKVGFIKKQKLLASLQKAFTDFDIRPQNPQLRVGQMSGGNQQKLVVAREIERQPQLLIAAQPTRGVDIGAIEIIHEQIMKLRDSGAAIFLISSELEELMKLSDRIYVICSGEIMGELQRKDFDEKKIGLMMTGAKP